MTTDNTGASRRDFFYLAGVLAAGAASGRNRVKAVHSVSPQIGILLATTFTTGILEARLDGAKARGLPGVQMSMAPPVCRRCPTRFPPNYRIGCAANRQLAGS